MMNSSHHYFILNPSPWPLLISINAFSLMISFLILVKFSMSYPLFMSIFTMATGSFFWWINYSSEFSLEGSESLTLEMGLKYAMLLFISSEVFFFFSFFWSYFHFFMSPTMETSLTWPPFSVQSFDCLNVPLINTLILLASGVSVTISHMYLIESKFKNSCWALGMTIALGLVFTMLQAMEYQSSFFSISDSTFGASFFMLTGFHGIHVIIGTIFLTTVLLRMNKINPSKECLSFEMASWYWHFVDVVWIFLFFVIYYMNS